MVKRNICDLYRYMKKWISMQVAEKYAENVLVSRENGLEFGERPDFHLMEISFLQSMKKNVDLRMHHI